MFGKSSTPVGVDTMGGWEAGRCGIADRQAVGDIYRQKGSLFAMSMRTGFGRKANLSQGFNLPTSHSLPINPAPLSIQSRSALIRYTGLMKQCAHFEITSIRQGDN